jgi:hypothetical protein
MTIDEIVEEAEAHEVYLNNRVADENREHRRTAWVMAAIISFHAVAAVFLLWDGSPILGGFCMGAAILFFFMWRVIVLLHRLLLREISALKVQMWSMVNNARHLSRGAA